MNTRTHNLLQRPFHTIRSRSHKGIDMWHGCRRRCTREGSAQFVVGRLVLAPDEGRTNRNIAHQTRFVEQIYRFHSIDKTNDG